jgi:restriction endonuclease Mrr
MPIGPGGSLQSVNGGRKYIASILKKFDPSSRDAALEELRQYLIRNYSDIREITPAKMEELVRAVYKDFLDCDVHYFTNNTFAPDGGIDLVALEGSDGVETAIQVKRRLSDVAESVSTVREFLGAMAIQGYRRGIFVTTGRFSKVAQTLPSRVTSIYGTEVALDLVDAEGFERLLRRTRYCSEDSHPWYYAIGKYRAAEAISWNAFMASGDEA